MSGREGDAKFANAKPTLAFDAMQYSLSVGDRSGPVSLYYLLLTTRNSGQKPDGRWASSTPGA